MTQLADEIAFVKNVHFAATEQGEKIIFLHTVNAGPANQSYGIQVAQLAGIPRKVIQLARQKLQELENQGGQVASRKAVYFPVQSDLFAEPTINAAVKLLQEIHPDQLSPREALEWLYKLKQCL